MTILVGPVLRFQSVDTLNWNISLILATDDGKPAVECALHTGNKIKANELLKSKWGVLYRYDLSIPIKAKSQKVSYKVESDSYAFVVPGQDEVPRLAYASCNGFSDPKLMKSVEDNNANWTRMLKRHNGQDPIPKSLLPNLSKGEPFHLLLMGGDQVYCDSIWYAIDELKKWAKGPTKARAKADFSAALAQQVADEYFHIYIERWAKMLEEYDTKKLESSDMAEVLASIPTLMMWDDHDIFDGYGSYVSELNKCKVHQGLYRAASDAFRAFQLHLPSRKPVGDAFIDNITANDDEVNYSQMTQIGSLGILQLDTRSQRDESKLISAPVWDAIFDRLDATKGLKHLIVMASVPVMYPGLAIFEKALDIVLGYQDLEDDLRDHWTSPPRRGERTRLIHRLLSYAKTNRTRVTLLSGDVHVAALGLIESDQHGAIIGDNVNSINQLVSTAIVHPPPAGFPLKMLFNMISDETEAIDRGITGSMTLLPNSNDRFLFDRNWLTLTPDPNSKATDDYRLWANWWPENHVSPLIKVIHPAVPLPK